MTRYNQAGNYEGLNDSNDGKRYFGRILKSLATGVVATTLLTGCVTTRDIQRRINDYEVKRRIQKQYCCENPNDPECKSDLEKALPCLAIGGMFAIGIILSGPGGAAAVPGVVKGVGVGALGGM